MAAATWSGTHHHRPEREGRRAVYRESGRGRHPRRLHLRQVPEGKDRPFETAGQSRGHARSRHHQQALSDRYTIVSEAVNEARDLINEPGSAVVPETMAEAARKIAKESNLDLKVWDEKRLAKEGYNGLIQVGRGSSHPPRMIRLAIGRRKRSSTSPLSAKASRSIRAASRSNPPTRCGR